MTDGEGNAAAALATGRRVLKIEADALAGFAETLAAPFADAVEAILKVEGRVIVSGMGKSGHVGRKIAATLASTGTPANFVHPAEASHGDLGMLTKKDLALVLSNSGETPELADLIGHTRRFGIPLIGVASKPESTLLKAADIALVLPKAEEACHVGMAPTTSTTLTLALGDALAVALMERRNFTPEKFREFHPGGKLGAALLQVSDLMHSGDDLPIVSEDTKMSDALLTITSKGFGVAAVVGADGRIAGVITDGDLRRNMQGLLERRAGDVATKSPITIRPTAFAQEAVKRMQERRITALFVAERDAAGQPKEPLGLLHIHDCLRAGVV
jgi:arabinose-5-phosphate isomerase